ncbi:MAG: hypothetical protein ACREC1_05600 [Methylovirgula sp.]
MAKLIFGLGLATSLAMLAIAMLGTPVTNERATDDSARAAAGCSVEALPLDEGYGVSRTVLRRNCTN